jgi:hypothetical protein
MTAVAKAAMTTSIMNALKNFFIKGFIFILPRKKIFLLKIMFSLYQKDESFSIMRKGEKNSGR